MILLAQRKKNFSNRTFTLLCYIFVAIHKISWLFYYSFYPQYHLQMYRVTSTYSSPQIASSTSGELLLSQKKKQLQNQIQLYKNRGSPHKSPKVLVLINILSVPFCSFYSLRCNGNSRLFFKFHLLPYLVEA